MTNSLKSRLGDIEYFESNADQESDQRQELSDLSSDPDYLSLLGHYQQAEFSECLVLLGVLEARYPEAPELQSLRDDLNMRMSVRNVTSAIRKGEVRANSKVTAKLLLFALFGLITIAAVFFAASIIFLQGVPTINNEDSSTLSSLYSQADALLRGGQPGPALEIVEKIQTLDPDYPDLQELIDRTDALVKFEANYQRALNLIKLGDKNKALLLLKQLESENPGMWDIPLQIAEIEKEDKIAEYLKDGNSAYQKEDWEKVVLAYENALSLDQSLNDPVMVEQLVFAYLNRIIGMLQSDSNAIEELELAEQYFRKASALIPQNKEFANQRANLQEVSSNLLEQKFAQIGKANLADKAQTTSSIAKAVSYLGKALSLNPNNEALKDELSNAKIYQVAFQYFIDTDWAQAVTRLEKLVAEDKNYAGGNAGDLLYEAYYALGKQYYNASIYLDACTYLEQAEILAWADSDNMLKLFQVQALLGDSIGKLDDFKSAVSYYQYAFNAINFQGKIWSVSALVNKYSEANRLAANGDYRNALAAYQELAGEIEYAYSSSDVEISPGVCLALFASDNLSTLDAVLKANNLHRNMVITFGRTLSVPSIQK